MYNSIDKIYSRHTKQGLLNRAALEVSFIDLSDNYPSSEFTSSFTNLATAAIRAWFKA